jgi:hypothetical protein
MFKLLSGVVEGQDLKAKLSMQGEIMMQPRITVAVMLQHCFRATSQLQFCR